jgi:hypothetical protein
VKYGSEALTIRYRKDWHAASPHALVSIDAISTLVSQSVGNAFEGGYQSADRKTALWKSGLIYGTAKEIR